MRQIPQNKLGTIQCRQKRPSNKRDAFNAHSIYECSFFNGTTISIGLVLNKKLNRAWRNFLSKKTFLTFFSSLFMAVSTHLYAQTSSATAQYNQLHNHNSEYLAMHATDPVDWQLWSADILKQAQAENKLIFISSGYFSCHWCHVMQHENYQNVFTAKQLNQHFISVKIDRELNPELDKTLIEFAEKATGQAGWPQHVILTPSGYPFAAFIYLPNEAFNQRMDKIQSLWTSQPKEIEILAKQAAGELESSQTFIANKHTTPKIKITQESFTQALINQVRESMDDLSGGLKSTAKFPKAPLLNALLTIETLPEDIEEWLIITLEQMQSEHLFDHVHGGFYRYTVDPNWQIPHFEKMAYDNALLTKTYLTAGQRWQREDFLNTAQQTLHYLDKHLYSKKSALYLGSQSALDKNGLEGGDYLWTKNRLQEILSESEFKTIYQAWSLDKPAPYELGWHPKPFEPQSTWLSVKQKLTTPKSKIPTDTKSILGWNGLMLSALSQAGQVLDNPDYLSSAQQLAKRLTQLINESPAPRALSADNEFMGEANLQDYAFIKRGLQDYQAWSGDKQFAQDLQEINRNILNQFYGSTGWRYDANPILKQQKGEWLMSDNPLPSLTAVTACLKPDSLQYIETTLLNEPIEYASYITELNCMHHATNSVK